MASQQTKVESQLTAHREEPIQRTARPSALLKFMWGLTVAGLVILFFSTFYFFPYTLDEDCSRTWESQDVKLSLHTPGTLSAGDAEEIHATATNAGNNTAMITATISYSGTNPCLMGNSESNVLAFGSLPPHGQGTGRMRIEFPICLNQVPAQKWLGQRAEFVVWLAVESQPSQPLGTISLPFAPIPATKTIGTMSGTLLLGLVGWSVMKLWDWAEKLSQSATDAEEKPETQGGRS